MIIKNVFHTIIALFLTATLGLLGCKDDCAEPASQLSLDVKNVWFTRENTVQHITLDISPENTSDWQIVLPPWVSAEPKNGTFNSEQVITLMADTSKLADSYVDDVFGIVTAKAGKIEGTIGYSHYISSDIFMGPGTGLGYVHLWYSETEGSVYLHNNSDTTISYELKFSAECLSVEDNFGTLNRYQDTAFRIFLDKTELEPGRYTEYIELEDNKGGKRRLEIVFGKYIETKKLFYTTIKDCKFDRNSDKIYIISDNTNQFLKIDPNEEVFDSIPLTYQPKRLSINPSGTFAAIYGDPGHLTIVNLSNLSTLEYVLNSNKIGYMELDDNNMLYYTNYGVSLDQINVFNLNTISYSTVYARGIDGYMPLMVHPSGEYLYAMSSNEAFKFSISDTSTEWLYKKEINNHYLGWPQIINSFGNRLFADESVFRLSETQSLDMEFVADIQPYGEWNEIQDQSSVSGNLLVNFSGGISSRGLIEYDNNTLTPKGYEFEFPEFYVDAVVGYVTTGGCRCAFYSNDGTKIFVIVSADSGHGDGKQWSIVKYDIE